MHQALARRQGIESERDSVDDRVPAVGLAGLHGGEVSLDEAFAPHGPHGANVHVANAAAGLGKLPHHHLRGGGLIEGDELPAFAATGVEKRFVNQRQFDRDENFFQVGLNKNRQRLQVTDRGGLQKSTAR